MRHGWGQRAGADERGHDLAVPLAARRPEQRRRPTAPDPVRPRTVIPHSDARRRDGARADACLSRVVLAPGGNRDDLGASVVDADGACASHAIGPHRKAVGALYPLQLDGSVHALDGARRFPDRSRPDRTSRNDRGWLALVGTGVRCASQRAGVSVDVERRVVAWITRADRVGARLEVKVRPVRSVRARTVRRRSGRSARSVFRP